MRLVAMTALVVWLGTGAYVLDARAQAAQAPQGDEQSLEELLNTPVSSVSRIHEQSAESPAVITTVTRERIRELGYHTLWDILIHTPGFWEIQDVNDKLIGVRGVHSSTNQKFLLLINGKRLTENFWNLTDVDVNISLANVKRVEIVRGPGSAIYGRAALTAVINVVTDADLDGSQVDLSLGSFGYRKLGYSFARARGGDRFELWGHLMESEGQEFEIPAAEDGAKNRVDGLEVVDRYVGPNGGFGARVSHGAWELNLLAQARTYKQPRDANAGLSWQILKADDYYNDTYRNGLMSEEHKYLVADLERHFGFGGTENSLAVHYTWSELRLREPTRPSRDVTFPAGFSDAARREYALGEVFEFDVSGYRVELDYFGRKGLGESRSLIWGVEANRTVPVGDKFTANYVSTVQGSKIVNTPTADGLLREKPDGVFDRLRTEHLVSAFSELRYGLGDKTHLAVGARYDLHIKGEDYRQEGQRERYPDPAADEKRAKIEKTSSQFSPRVAVIFEPWGTPRLVFKAIYNRAFIAPAPFYRYADPSTSYAGGPWLEAETLDNYTLAAEGSARGLGWRAVYFLNVNKNLLVRDTTYQPARYASVGELSMQGLEGEVFWSRPRVEAFASYSYLKGVRSITDDATEAKWIMADGSIKNFPVHSGTAGLTGRFLHRDLSVSALLSWNGEVKTPVGAGVGAGTVVDLDGSQQVDLTLRWHRPRLPLLGALDASIAVRNVFNQEILRGGTVLRPYHKPGRAVVVTLVKEL